MSAYFYLQPIDVESVHITSKLLAKHFKIPAPKILISNKNANRGFYIHRTVWLSKTAPLWVLAHEWAHHLDYCVNGHRRESHSEIFYWHLRHVIANIGGPLFLYPWDKEYKQIKRWARRDGLLELDTNK